MSGVRPVWVSHISTPPPDSEVLARHKRWCAAQGDYRRQLAAYMREAGDLQPIANLHGPVDEDNLIGKLGLGGTECDGCDFQGYDAEPPEWPCRTAQLLGDLLGVQRPVQLEDA